MNRGLKITFITLLVVLIAIISFAGLFVQDTKFMKNLLPDYTFGMDLTGYRAVTVKVSDETNTVYYDKDGNEVDTEQKDGTSKKVPVNSADVLTKDNYLTVKKMVQARLKKAGVSEYLVRLNENDGTMTVEIPEDNMTDTASQLIYTIGKFTIEDEDGNVLLDNSNLDKVQVGYSNQSSSGTSVYMSFIFNDDSVDKLKEISNTYVSSTDESGNTVEKKVSMKIDGTTLLQTSFDEEIANGVLPISLGTSSDSETLSSYIEQASSTAVLLNNGPLPIKYTVDQNRYIKSDIELQDFFIPAIILGAILLIAFIVLIIKYKKLGILGIISYIGFIALLLVIVRYTNLVITIEGIFGILISAILNYMLLVYILHSLKKKEKDLTVYKRSYNKSMLSMVLVLFPTLIIGIVLCFAQWLPIYSFGTIIFWGVLVMAIWNAIVTRILFLSTIKENN